MTAEIVSLDAFRRGKRATPKPEPEIAPITIEDAVEICLKHPETLTAWEAGFLASLRRFRRLSPKQLAVLQRIFDKVCSAAESSP